MANKPLVVTDDNFQAEITSDHGLAIVDFWATWCSPCKAVAPIVDQIALEYEGRVKVAKLDVDQNQKTAQRFNIRSIPTLLFFKDGQVVDQIVGAVAKGAVENKIQKHL